MSALPLFVLQRAAARGIDPRDITAWSATRRGDLELLLVDGSTTCA